MYANPLFPNEHPKKEVIPHVLGRLLSLEGTEINTGKVSRPMSSVFSWEASGIETLTYKQPP